MRKGKFMKKMRLLAKGTLALALGLSSMFLAEKTEVLPANTAYAASQDEDSQSLRTSLEAKQAILGEKMEFAKEFKKTSAYKNASSTNKTSFDKEASQVESAFLSVNKALSTGKGLAKADEDASPVLNAFYETLNSIYGEDELLSEVMKANLAIGTNKLEHIPRKYRQDYLNASKALQDEYQAIWLGNKVYKEKEVAKILTDYQRLIVKINDVNRGQDLSVKIKKALKRNQEKVEGIKYLMKEMPESAKRYEKTLNEALDQAQKAIDKALDWLAKNDK